VIEPTGVVPPPPDAALSAPLASPPALVAAADTPAPATVAVAGAQTSRAKVSVSGAGARGPGGCVQRAFKVSVLGANILRVDFSIDGRTLKRVIRRDASGRYRADVSLAGLTRTSHRIVARVAFRNGFAPQVRNLPVTFRRCAQIATAPSFTG
jgi:hypothetical protein